KPPLVAMHGIQIASTSWLPLLPTLAAAHRVTMIDAIGQVSKSIATKPTTGAADVVAWLDETLHALGIDRAGRLVDGVVDGDAVRAGISRSCGSFGSDRPGRTRQRAASAFPASHLPPSVSAVGVTPGVVFRHFRYAGGPGAAASGPVAANHAAVRCRHDGLQIRVYPGRPANAFRPASALICPDSGPRDHRPR